MQALVGRRRVSTGPEPRASVFPDVSLATSAWPGDVDDDGFVVVPSPDSEVPQGEIHRGMIQIGHATGITALVDDPFDDELGMVARQLFAFFLVEGIENVIEQVLGKLDLLILANLL